jgi:hypothetical protein
VSAPIILTVALTDDQLGVLVERVAERLRTDNAPELVDAATLAQTLGVSRDTVYAHADELGGRRVGDGARPRLRFDPAVALDTWQPATTEQPARTAARRRRTANGRSNLLPVVER